MATPSRIEIADWTPAWAAEFRERGAALRAALGPLALRIDHIGSTAIIGLGAKGDFFWESIRRADQWAWETGWRPGPSDA